MFTLKRHVKETQEKRANGGVGKRTPGEIRVQKDLSQIDTPDSMEIIFDDPDQIMDFKIKLQPKEGLYRPGTFMFNMKIPPDYPHQPPKVLCTTKVYHPNIDLEGHVCLNILRGDWKPVLTLNAVLYGLQLLFLEPNPDDPLNKDAADLMKRSPHEFSRNVATSIRGGFVHAPSRNASQNEVPFKPSGGRPSPT